MKKIEIPKVFAKQRLILLNKSDDPSIGKRPLEKGWTISANYSYDDMSKKEIDKYGVLCGYNSLVVVDCDNIKFQEKCEENPLFSNTFIVKTAGKGLNHYYFYVDDEKPITHRLDQFTENGKIKLADIQGKGTQVVGPGSKFGEKSYEIINNCKIKKVSYIDLITFCKTCMPSIQVIGEYQKKRKHAEQDDYMEFDPIIAYIKSKITIRDILEEIGINTRKGRNSECPFHSSVSGQCFSYDDHQFHCFHCNRSGSMFDLIMEYYEHDFIAAKNLLAEKVGIPDNVVQQAKVMAIKTKKAELTEYIVQQFFQKNKVYTIRNDEKPEMWIYSDGIYIPHAKSFIKGFCRAVLNEFYTSNIANQIISKIEADTYVDEEDFFSQRNKNEIVVRNGILNIITKEIKGYDQEKIFFNKIPVFYDQNNEKPKKVISFMESCLSNDNEVKTIQEMIGYTLLDETKFKKGFMLIGAGDNGKSVMIDLISEFLGKENISNISLHDLDNDTFAAAGLFGKFANINADIGKGKLNETEMVKNTISGDSIYANRKFLTPIKFRNRAKMIFAANNLPETDDETDGFFTRWQIIEFPYSFKRETEYNKLTDAQLKSNRYKIADQYIFEKLVTDDEMTKMLNWALDGLHRLLENKDFSMPTDVNKMRSIWIKKSSSMKAFIFDCIEFTYDEENYILPTDLHVKYIEYCRENELKPQLKKDCNIVLNDYPIKYKQKKFFTGSNSWEIKRIWEGMKFK